MSTERAVSEPESTVTGTVLAFVRDEVAATDPETASTDYALRCDDGTPITVIAHDLHLDPANTPEIQTGDRLRATGRRIHCDDGPAELHAHSLDRLEQR